MSVVQGPLGAPALKLQKGLNMGSLPERMVLVLVLGRGGGMSRQCCTRNPRAHLPFAKWSRPGPSLPIHGLETFPASVSSC